MTHVLRVGVADQIAYFRAYNTDGSGKTDVTSSTTGLSLSVFRTGLASVSIASLSNKAADNTTHADGAIRNVGGNLYTVDLPDAASANQCSSIGVRGTFTGGVVEPVPHPIVAYDPASVAVGANTTTPPTVVAVADEIQTRTIARVTLVDTTTTNTDMRGTNNAMLAASYTAPANSDITAIRAKTDNLPANPASTADVQVTVNPNITVNPTVLSNESVLAIQDGLATETNATSNKEEVLTAIGTIEAGSGSTPEEVGEYLERDGGVLNTLLSKFNGISRLAEWLRR